MEEKLYDYMDWAEIEADDTETNLSDKLTGSHILTAKIEDLHLQTLKIV